MVKAIPLLIRYLQSASGPGEGPVPMWLDSVPSAEPVLARAPGDHLANGASSMRARRQSALPSLDLAGCSVELIGSVGLGEPGLAIPARARSHEAVASMGTWSARRRGETLGTSRQLRAKL